MKTLRQSIFLPVFALIAFLVFGAGTVLADSSNEGVGGWGSEAVEAGQITLGVPGTLSGIDAPATSHPTGSEPAGDEPKRRAFVGTLDGITGASVDSITVILQTGGGGEQVIGLFEGEAVAVMMGVMVDNPFTRTPGGPRAGTAKNGAKVVVLAKQSQTEAGIWEAIFILVKPVAPPYTYHGVALKVDGDQVIIETPDGDTETVTLPAGVGDVTPGEVITVFQDNSGKAKGLVRAEDVKNRLKTFLDDAEADVDEPEADEDGRGNKHDKEAAHAERIANFLARFNERQARLLDRVIGRGASDSVEDKLAEVRARIQAQRLEHRGAIDRIRAKLDRAHPAHSHRGGSDAADQTRPDNSDRGRPEGAGQVRPEQAGQNQGGERPSADDGKGRGRGRGQGGSSDTPSP